VARQAQQSALQLIDFFLSSILQMDATGHQETALRYAIPAALAVPDATLQTLKDSVLRSLAFHLGVRMYCDHKIKFTLRFIDRLAAKT
jgi:hypothetical protein